MMAPPPAVPIMANNPAMNIINQVTSGTGINQTIQQITQINNANTPTRLNIRICLPGAAGC